MTEPEMLSSDTRVQPNVVEVAAKVIDGEAIIMNLSSGLYYSMDNIGAAIWELAESGHSLAEISDVLAERYGTSRETVLGDVTGLMDELLAENLVQVSDAAPDRGPDPVPSLPETPYAAPVLNKYSDMADLLALDPPMPGLGDAPGEE